MQNGMLVYTKSSEWDKEEEELYRIMQYLHDLNELYLQYDLEQKKGYIFQNISIYQQCIKLDFDINATDVANGETLIFTLIRKNDAQNLRVLLFEYQIEKKIQINIDIHNLKGKSPFYYALRNFIRTGSDKLYLLLLRSNADPNFPCIKRAQIAKSPLNYLLNQVHAKSDINAVDNYFYWTMINDLIYYGAALYHHEILIVPSLLIPRKISDELVFDEWKKNYLKNMIDVCKKLQLSLNTIQDANGNNPIHLLLQQYYKNDNDDRQIEVNIRYLYRLFDLELKWDATSHLPESDSKMDISKQDINTESAANQYFPEAAKDIKQYLKQLKSRMKTEDEMKEGIDEKEVNEGKTGVIVRVMKELQNINWKWMQFTNKDENLPITAVLREDDIPVGLLKTAHDALNTKFKKKSFISSIKSNRFAMAIICNYIIFQIHKTNNLEGKRLSWQVTYVYENEEMLKQKQKEKQDERKMKQEYIPPKPFQDNASVTFNIISKGLFDASETHKTAKTYKNVNKLEIAYSAIVESLSIGDLLTDFIVLRDLIATNNQWWTTFMLLFLLAPYLVSFCSLGSIFQSREKDVANLLCLFLITPFSLLLLIVLDLTFMLFVVFNLIGLLFCFWNPKFIAYIDRNEIFQMFNVTHMEIKGYRRLRTLSQLAFETIPQTLLQVRMMLAVQNKQDNRLDVSLEALAISIGIAIVHFTFEIIILFIESKAAKVSMFKYGIECLNARLNWVPLLNIIFRHHDDDNTKNETITKRENHNIHDKVDWEKLEHSLCTIPYHLDFEFCEGSFRRLYTQITRIPRFTDGSDTEVKPLVTLLGHTGDVTWIKLGDESCKFVTLRDLSRLYRNSDNRVILDGKTIDWDKKVRKQLNQKSITINAKSSVLILPHIARKMKKYQQFDNSFQFDESVFGDFMQHGEVDALYAIWTGIRQEDRDQIDIFALKQDSLTDDITDLCTLKRFWRHNYCFGNSCNECHIIYDRIVKYYDAMLTLQKRNKSETEKDLLKYGNMILLMLFFTRSAIFNHKCPQCNISWKEYVIDKLQLQYGESSSYSPYTIDITEQLPKYLKMIFFTVDDDGDEKDSVRNRSSLTQKRTERKIPFVLAECSDILSEVMGLEIMKNNTEIHEPLFATNKNSLDQPEWRFIDDDGIWEHYSTQHKQNKAGKEDELDEFDELQMSINDQFSKQYESWEFKKKLSTEQQKPMKFEDDLIEINLNKGSFFGEDDKKEVYKIMVDFHHVPPKYTQVSTQTQYERTVKLFAADSALELNEYDENRQKRQLFKKLDKKDLDQNLIYILSSIIEYEPGAHQSYAIIKNHFDAKQKGEHSYFDKIIGFAKQLKLRHGYDKLLMSIERFYQKRKIQVKASRNTSIIVANIGKKQMEDETVLGIKELNINVVIKVKQIEKVKQNENNNEYIITKQKTEIVSGLQSLDSIRKNVDEALQDTIDCEIWLKIPINPQKKQIESWNDILLKSINIELFDDEKENKNVKSNRIKLYKREISLNLSENFSALGSWNPSLYDYQENISIETIHANQLEFEIKCNADEEENENQYDINGFIKSVDITLIMNKEEDPKIIDEIDTKFWIEHQAVLWKWMDNNDSMKLKPFDLLSNKQIERDYHRLKTLTDNKQKTLIIPVTAGVWFNQPNNKNKYQIRIVRSAVPHLYYQVNIETGSTRVVKREVLDYKPKTTNAMIVNYDNNHDYLYIEEEAPSENKQENVENEESEKNDQAKKNQDVIDVAMSFTMSNMQAEQSVTIDFGACAKDDIQSTQSLMITKSLFETKSTAL